MTFLQRLKTGNGLALVRPRSHHAWLAACAWGVLLTVQTVAAIASEGGEEEFKGLPQFEASTFPSQLFWLVVSFGIFFYLMTKVFVPKVGARIELREKVISDNVNGAEKLLTRGKKMEADLEKKLTTAREQARGEITSAAAIISAKQEESLKKFQKKSDDVIADANKMLQKIKSDIEKEKQTLVNNLSKEIVKKILS